MIKEYRYIFSDRYFGVCNDGKIEGLVTWVKNGINAGIGLCVAGLLGTGFDGDSYGITLGIDKGIEISFQIYILWSVVM